MVLVSHYGKTELKQKFGEQTWLAWILCFEILIMYEEFLKLDQITRTELGKLQSANIIPKMLDFVKRVIERHDGMGMKFLKFHLPTHTVEAFRFLGLIKAVDGGLGEKRHIPFAKQTAQRTQKHKATLEFQTAGRLVDALAIDLANTLTFDGLEDITTNEHAPDARIETKCLRKFVMTTEGFFKPDRNMEVSKNKVLWSNRELQKQVFDALVHLLNISIGNSMIVFPMKVVIHGNKYRAYPVSFYKHEDWHEWCYVNWESSGFIPSRIICFFKIDYLMDRRKLQHVRVLRNVTGPGVYALVQSMTESPKAANSQTRLWTEGALDVAPGTNIIDILAVHWTSIVGPCTVVQDHTNPSNNSYLVMQRKAAWKEIFLSLDESH